MWHFPLKKYNYTLPIDPLNDVGAFSFVRKHDIHAGVDLYCEDGAEVFAVEDGIVIDIINFTGDNANSPWWNNTQAILVKGLSGIVVYGEISPSIIKNDHIQKGQKLGIVKQVLKKDKGKTPMSMLHLELYRTDINDTVVWNLNEPKPENLMDPTLNLIESFKHFFGN